MPEAKTESIFDVRPMTTASQVRYQVLGNTFHKLVL